MQNNVHNIIIEEKYSFISSNIIGKGSFGVIYKGEIMKTKEPIAIKEEKSTNKKLLLNEYKIIEQLQEGRGIIKVHSYFSNEKCDYIVMEYMNKNLDDVFEYNKYQFSIKNILIVANHILDIIEFIHSKGFIHRDIKPENFLINKDNKSLKIIDFGLSLRYIDEKTKEHIEQITHKSLIGTPIFASINNHMGLEQSRRDDLESFGYMIAYFCKGILPWQGLFAKSKKEKYEKIKRIKVSYKKSLELFKMLPYEFTEYMKYVYNLEFKEEPNYKYIRDIFNSIWKRYDYGNDYKLDIFVPE